MASKLKKPDFLQDRSKIKMLQSSYFVARMDNLIIKLDVCLPLAYPSTIYLHFTSLM